MNLPDPGWALARSIAGLDNDNRVKGFLIFCSYSWEKQGCIWRCNKKGEECNAIFSKKDLVKVSSRNLRHKTTGILSNFFNLSLFLSVVRLHLSQVDSSSSYGITKVDDSFIKEFHSRNLVRFCARNSGVCKKRGKNQQQFLLISAPADALFCPFQL